MHGSLDPDENVMDHSLRRRTYATSFKGYEKMKGYYSVFNPRGEKIADCGVLRDAVTLIGFRNAKWEGHYYQFTPIYQTIDINSKKYFPSDDIIVNMDGGVGGSWNVKSDSIKLQPGVGGAVEFTT
jgi:hypothetical protein